MRRWLDRLLGRIIDWLAELRHPKREWKPIIRAADKHLDEVVARARSQETYHDSIESFIEGAKEDVDEKKVEDLDTGEAQLRKDLGIPKDMAKTGWMRSRD